MIRKNSLYIFSLLLLVFFGACVKEKDVVVVYTTVDQVFSEPVLKEFEKETGIVVKAVYDTEETKSTGVLNRIIAEKDNPQCDIFWSGDPVRSAVLSKKGITAAYESPVAADINKIFKDPGHHWTGFSARARVLIFNNLKIDPLDAPQSVFDLTKEKFRGKVAIANPLFGTTTFHMAALFSALGDEKAKEFLKDLKNNDVVIATSNGDVKRQVSEGKVICGLTDTDDAFEAMKEGETVGVVFLDQQGLGTLIMPNTVSMLKNSPNQENAKKLMDYLLNRKTEAALAESCAQMPLHKGVKVPKGVPSLDEIVPMKIDYNKTADKLEEIQNYLKEWVEN